VSGRILYLQYTNPAGYPPLQHSASMLIEHGWDVMFVGIPVSGAGKLVMPRHDRMRVVEAGRASGGRLGTIKYLSFTLRALQHALTFQPQWIYASDALAAPAALLLRRTLSASVVYHEHDGPAAVPVSVRKARVQLAGSADVVIAPAEARLAMLPAGRGQRFVVWNCPRRSEAAAIDSIAAPASFRLVYQGSLSRERLTPAFIDALTLLPEHVRLDIFGYETAGHRGYSTELLQRAEQAGVRARVAYHGALPARAELMRRLRGHQLGIATIATETTDQNLATLAGASNKAFEYLACGMPLLVSAHPAWQRMYEVPGYAVSCSPSDANSIASAVQRLVMQPEQARAMGAAGQQRILSEWNYETQFAPVLKVLTS
jgi:glycosyltransferase involved in cell wall biosynthesis